MRGPEGPSRGFIRERAKRAGGYIRLWGGGVRTWGWEGGRSPLKGWDLEKDQEGRGRGPGAAGPWLVSEAKESPPPEKGGVPNPPPFWQGWARLSRSITRGLGGVPFRVNEKVSRSGDGYWRMPKEAEREGRMWGCGAERGGNGG